MHLGLDQGGWYNSSAYPISTTFKIAIQVGAILAVLIAYQQRFRHVLGGLVRLAVGCEDVEDIRADLEQALAVAVAGVTADEATV